MNAAPFHLELPPSAPAARPVRPAYGTLDLRRADCMEVMAGVPDGHFDLAVVDPPYGLDKKLLAGNTGMMKNCFRSVVEKGWDKKPGAEYFEELRRVSNHQVIWGGY